MRQGGINDRGVVWVRCAAYLSRSRASRAKGYGTCLVRRIQCTSLTQARATRRSAGTPSRVEETRQCRGASAPSRGILPRGPTGPTGPTQKCTARIHTSRSLHCSAGRAAHRPPRPRRRAVPSGVECGGGGLLPAMTSHLLDRLKSHDDRRMPKGECVFCDIIERRQPAYIVAETDDVIAFLDVLPIRAGTSTQLTNRTHARGAQVARKEHLGSESETVCIAHAQCRVGRAHYGKRYAHTTHAAFGITGLQVAANQEYAQAVDHVCLLSAYSRYTFISSLPRCHLAHRPPSKSTIPKGRCS